jgi:general secretion pathway protein D
VLPSRRPADAAKPNAVAPAQSNADSINLTPSNRILVIPRAGESSGNSDVGPNGGRIIRGRTPGTTP